MTTKYLNIKLFLLFIVGLISPLLTGCSDAPDELTEVTYNRVFSLNPDDMTVNVINKTTLRLTWKEVHNADGYTIELFADDENMLFEGEPSVTIANIEYQTPYLIDGLDGETIYSGRIQGVSNTTNPSHWITFSFETEMENIFHSIGNGLGATSVTLSWEAGSEVTHITIRSAGEEVVTQTLSADEIEEGSITIEGLTGNTTYTAQIYNNTKSRGTITFTTNPDLGNAIAIYPDDDLKDILENAEDEDEFALMPGIHTASTINVTKSISLIAADANNLPIIEGVTFNINEGVNSLIIRNLILQNSSNYIIQFNKTDLYVEEIIVENCIIRDLGKGFIYNNYASELNIFTFNNCIMYNSGDGDIFDFRKGPMRNVSIKNSTFYNFKNNRDVVRIDNDNAGIFGGGTTANIEYCTFYSIGSSKDKALFYVRYQNNICTLKDCIITNTDISLTRTSNTNPPSYNNNFYYDAVNVINNNSSGTVEDPGFVDPDNGDFNMTNDNVYYSGAGDPRWSLAD